jgi:hypothetical protein
MEPILEELEHSQIKVNNGKPITEHEYIHIASTYYFDNDFVSKASFLRIEPLALDLLKNNPGILFSANTIAEMLDLKDCWVIDNIEKSLDNNPNIKKHNTQLYLTASSSMIMPFYEFPKKGQI